MGEIIALNIELIEIIKTVIVASSWLFILMDLENCNNVNRAGQAREQWRVMKTSNIRPRDSAGIVLINWPTAGSWRRTFLCQFTSFGDTFFWLHTVWVSNDSEDWTGLNFVSDSDTQVGEVRALQSAVSSQYLYVNLQSPSAKVLKIYHEKSWIYFTISIKRRTAVAQWLRCCATNRKVAGSIPDGVTVIFHWHNPSGRTMPWGWLSL